MLVRENMDSVSLVQDIFICFFFIIYCQKIDKYKKKCRENIFTGKLLTKIFPHTERIQWEKKLKQSKKNDNVLFLPTELPTESIPSVILLEKSLVNCQYYSSC